MTLFPEVQKKAQAEIDAIIGLDRLPILSDRQSLPYMEALVKELHRWFVVSNLGKLVEFMCLYVLLHLKQGFLIASLKMTSTTAITSLRGA